MLKKEFYAFLHALMFLTRIPVKKQLPYSQGILNKSVKYSPFIGLLIGIAGALLYYYAVIFFNKELSIILLFIFFALITGAFHEDGLADFFDGFWGGFSRERTLEIMKDSRIGSYGTIALILNYFLKYQLYLSVSLPLTYLIPIIQSVSRLSAISFISTMSYAKESGKSKPLAQELSVLALLINSFLFFILSYFFFQNFAITILVVFLLFHVIFRALLIKKINGYTGDCLGAAQQISEILILMAVLVYENL